MTILDRIHKDQILEQLETQIQYLDTEFSNIQSDTMKIEDIKMIIKLIYKYMKNLIEEIKILNEKIEDLKKKAENMIKSESEPYIRIVQTILSEEYKEPEVNFRKVSERIISDCNKYRKEKGE